MWPYFAILGFGLLLAVVILATRNGSKSAQLRALKAELKKRAEEQKRANQTLDNVRNMSDNDVRGRLRTISGKQR